jgi:hypothetical protein
MDAFRLSSRSRWLVAPPPETFAKWQVIIIERIEAKGFDRVEAMFIYMVADQTGEEKLFFAEELDIPGMSRNGVMASILYLRRREVLQPFVGEFSTAFRFALPWRWLPHLIEQISSRRNLPF